MTLAERIANHHACGRHKAVNDHPFLKPATLYAAAGRGTLTLQPRSAEAATRTAITLRYRVTGSDLPTGAKLRIRLVGFNALPTFTVDPQPRGTVRAAARTSGAATLEVAAVNGFCEREVHVTLTSGRLQAGDEVVFTLRGNNAPTLSEVARPVTFFLEIEDRADQAAWRLVDRAILEVKPRAPVKLDCSSEPVAAVGATTALTLRLTDDYGNRVADRIEPAWKPQHGMTVTENDAVCVSSPGIYRLRGKDANTGIEIVSTPLKRTARQPPYRLAFGDLHVHDFLSPGLASPSACYASAMDMGLHFLALPIQTQGGNLTEPKWIIAKAMAEEYYRPGSFVTFPAFEWQHYAFGHKNVYFINPDQPFLSPYDKRYDTVPKLFRALRKSDALVAAHHVGYKLDVHVPGTDWKYTDETLQPVAEICSCHGSSERPGSERPLNAPGTGTFMQDAWAAGRHVGVIGGADSHSSLPVSSPREPRPYPGGLACVYTRDLTRQGIFEALRNRRCYATTGARMILEFDVNQHMLGSIVQGGPKHRKIHVSVAGTSALTAVSVFKNNRPVHELAPGVADVEFEFVDRQGPERREDWYYVKAHQDNGELAWSSPVWVGAASA
jgi:hypothetical protein